MCLPNIEALNRLVLNNVKFPTQVPNKSSKQKFQTQVPNTSSKHKFQTLWLVMCLRLSKLSHSTLNLNLLFSILKYCQN